MTDTTKQICLVVSVICTFCMFLSVLPHVFMANK